MYRLSWMTGEELVKSASLDLLLPELMWLHIDTNGLMRMDGCDCVFEQWWS